MKRSIEALKGLNLPATDNKTASEKRFSDGGQYRIEIPSTETPKTVHPQATSPIRRYTRYWEEGGLCGVRARRRNDERRRTERAQVAIPLLQ